MSQKFMQNFGLEGKNHGVCTGSIWHESTEVKKLEVFTPIDNSKIADVHLATRADYHKVVEQAQQASLLWRKVPAPIRGAMIRDYGLALQNHKDDLGALVSYEMGKSLEEGKGEVQEMIDICEFAVGLSRQLYGLTMHSERPSHRMYEQWHPLGIVGIISAFNFPVAVWSWNFTIATVCGNATLWKPSEKTPLTAIACMKLLGAVLKQHQVPEGLCSMLVGTVQEVGEPLVNDRRVALISATGSTAMGKVVAQKVAARLGRSLLELGGNNAMIVSKEADLKLAIPAIVFGAVGTAGQRCTSTRRVFIHEQIFPQVKEALLGAYKTLKIGTPLDASNHVGPLIDQEAVQAMQKALQEVKQQGGEILYGGEVLDKDGGCYVRPALVFMKEQTEIVKKETFAPILYLFQFRGEVTEAVAQQNAVDQGLSSALFSNNLRESEEFLSAWGSDCGIANVNIGTSGAEIGGAFGGEKETGGGRESGSDAWKAYMRRQTNTINFGTKLPLAQGINFEL